MELPRPCDFLGATIPLPVRVIGTRLKPFSLGHYLLLQRLGNPFVTNGVVSIPDLEQAIIICSRDYDGALKALDTWAGIWHARWLRFKAWISRASWADSVRTFCQYVENGSKPPSFLPKNSKSSRIAAPLPMLVKIVLQSRLNYSPQAALNVPWGMALHEYATQLAIDGRLDLVDEQLISDLQLASKPIEPSEEAALIAALGKVRRGA